MILVFVSALCLVFILYHTLSRTESPQPKVSSITSSTRDSLRVAIEEVFATFGLKPPKPSGANLNANIPIDIPIPAIHLELQDYLTKIDAVIYRAQSDPVSGGLQLLIGMRDSVIVTLHLIPTEESGHEWGRIAILIDDFGDRNDVFAQSFLDLSKTITISIIPGLPFTREIAELATARGCEILLHMPMQPEGNQYRKMSHMIMSDMTEPDIRKLVRQSMEALPEAVGMNNHMGSKITANRRVMTYILEEIKQKDLFYVDSRTSVKTVGIDVAQTLNLPCAERDVFLDSEFEKEFIRKQMQELAAKAKENGTAIGIGHCHRYTLDILREEIPKLEARGYQFIRVSEAVR